MTQTPNPDQEPQQPEASASSVGSTPRQPTRLWLVILTRTSLVGLVILLTAAVGVFFWLRHFIYRQLSPLVAKELARSLNRPSEAVQVGEVERFTLNGLRLGPSTIAATPTDPDSATVQAVEVDFNIWAVLQARRLDLGVRVIAPQVNIEQDEKGIWFPIVLAEEQPPGPLQVVIRSVQIDNGVLLLSPVPRPGQPRSVVQFRELNGRATVDGQGENSLLSLDLAVKTPQQGDLRLQGQVRGPFKPEALQADLIVRSNRLPLVDLSRLVQKLPGRPGFLPLQVQAGELGGNVTVKIRPEALPEMTGAIDFSQVSASLAGLPGQISQTSGRLRLQGQRFQIEQLASRYGQIPVQAKGWVNLAPGANPAYEISGQVRGVTIDDLVAAVGQKLPIAAKGDVEVDFQVTGQFDKPTITGQVAVLRSQIDRVAFAQIRSRFELADLTLTLPDLEIRPSLGGLIVGSGRVSLDPRGGLRFNLQASDLPADEFARLYESLPEGIKIGNLSARVRLGGTLENLQANLNFQAPQATYPTSGEVVLVDNRLLFRNVVTQVNGSQITGEGEVVGQQWTATIAGNNIPLDRFSPDTQGSASGQFRLTGRVDSFRPADIRGQGTLAVAPGLRYQDVKIPDAISARLFWDGRRLEVQQSTGDGFSVNGFIFARLEGPKAPEVTNIDLNVRLRDYQVSQIVALANRLTGNQTPPPLNLTGQVDFNGRLTGTPMALRLNGVIQTNDVVAGRLKFEPVMRGELNYATGQGGNFRLAGQRDNLTVAIAPNNLPESFRFRFDRAEGEGRLRDNSLQAEVRNLPLSMLNLPLLAGGLSLDGVANASVNVDIRRWTGFGEVAIARPTLGSFSAQSFRGVLRYENGVIALSEGSLKTTNNTYLLTATLVPGDDPKFRGKLEVPQGDFQELMMAAQWFEFTDLARGLRPPVYNRASALRLFPVGRPDDRLFAQLQRLAEIQRTVQIENERPTGFKLSMLKGTFSGAANFAGTVRTGLTAEFNFAGQNWLWGEQKLGNVSLRGDFKNDRLTVFAGLQADDTRIALDFSGPVSPVGLLAPDSLSGQLRVENLPLSRLVDQGIVRAQINGRLDGQVTLAGNLTNPQARGSIKIRNGTLNDTPIQDAQAGFSYNRGRLDFGGQLLASGTEPIRATGSIPLRLPIAFVVPPESDNIAVNISVRNEGLAIINLINKDVLWRGGQGLAQLTVEGTTTTPKVVGLLRLEKASFKASALPDEITDINGEVKFQGDRLVVQDMRGKLGQGDILARGFLPIAGTPRRAAADGTSNPVPQQPLDNQGQPPAESQPLTVTLDRLTINLDKIFNGKVDGQLAIGGSALEPTLGGVLQVSNGRVLLPDETQESDPQADLFEFDNLRLTLGDSIQIIRQPVLSFVASGDLLVNGSLSAPRPQGRIRLLAGQVNIFTAQFNLQTGAENTAEFFANRGLDPVLNITMVTNVPEVVRPPSVRAISSSEIADLPASQLGELQTVRVVARVNGPASQLENSLQLSSSPSRSSGEIITLLGGGALSALQQGDGTGFLLNLAGSALMSQLQGLFGNATSAVQFRLFPATVNSRQARATSGVSSGAGATSLAGELSADLTNNFSISIVRLLTVDQPMQYGIRYRPNDQIQIRGSTDFSGDSRAVVEYQTRF